MFRVGTSERASASRGTNPPGFCLTTTRARVFTGAETATAADVGIASSCPCLRLSGGTWWPGGGGRSCRMVVRPGGREWGMGPGLLSKKGRWAAWAERSTFHFHRSSTGTHRRGGWDDADCGTRALPLLIIFSCKLFTRPGTGLMVSLITCGQRRRGRVHDGRALTRGSPPSSCRPRSPRR